MNDFSTFYYINFNCQIYCLKCNLIAGKFNSKQNKKMNNIQISSFFFLSELVILQGWSGEDDKNDYKTTV